MTRRPAGWLIPRAETLDQRLGRFRVPPIAWLVLAMGLTAGLGLYRITELSFWLDEASSVFAARLDWLRPWEAMTAGGENGQHAFSLYMPLYFAILSAWLALGESELAVRSLSVVFAVASIPVVYALASRLYGPRAGIAAALLLSVNGFFIAHAQDARAYTLVVLFAAASTLLYVRALDRGGSLRWLGYGVVSGLGLYAHLSLALVLATHPLILPLVPRSRAHWKAALGGHAVTAIVAAPLLAIVALQSVPGLDWIAQPPSSKLPYIWTELAGHYTWQAIFYLGCLGAAGLIALRTALDDRPDAWRCVLPVAGVVVPIIGLFTLSQVRPLWQDRYLMAVLPAMVMLAALTLARLRPPWLAAAALAAVVLLSAQSVVTNAGVDEGYREEWREATAYVLSASRSDDGIVFYRPYVRMPFDYYVGLDDASGRAPESVYPRSATSAQGRGPAEYLADLGTTLTSGSEHERLWLILSHDRDGEREPILAWLEVRHGLLQTVFFEYVEVHLYVLRSSACCPL